MFKESIIISVRNREACGNFATVLHGTLAFGKILLRLLYVPQLHM